MNDFENGTAPVANSLAYLNLKLNDAIEQLDTLSARVDQLHDDLGFFSHSVNNVEMLIKRISHDVYEKTEEHPPYTVQRYSKWRIIAGTAIKNW